MPQIILTANIVVPNGPKFAFNQKLEVDAYDAIEVTVPVGTSDMQVVLPGSTDGMQFIAIKSDWFGENLFYKINSDAGSPRLLDQPHLLAGKGAISLFTDAPGVPPPSLFFTNSSTPDDAIDDSDAKVQILIGRDATPTPP